MVIDILTEIVIAISVAIIVVIAPTPSRRVTFQYPDQDLDLDDIRSDASLGLDHSSEPTTIPL